MLVNLGWTIEDWLFAYKSGDLNPTDTLNALMNSLDVKDPAWICLASTNQLKKQLDQLPPLQKGAIPAHLPLYGIPFVVKDNIDVAGFPTSVACPAFAYEPQADAPAVSLLRRAGAIVIAKTNMDQFATGLVGVRSPYGIPENPFHKDFIPGGSSSGSAVAVARGLVPFSLGTDTAGSGRVPAGFNNIVGWKPTRGYVSGRGVVPACRTLDCVSVFAMTVQDASTVGNLIGIFDPFDAYSHKKPARTEFIPESLQFAIPAEIDWFGDTQAQKAWETTLQKLKACGVHFSPVNFSPMHELAQLLYQNAWIAERTTAIGPFTESHREDVHPVVAEIIAQGKCFSAVDLCNAEYRRAELALKINDTISGYTALLVPTTPRFPTVQEVLEEPVSINSQLGTYTNFVNLANCCALACPGIFREDGLPFGITLIAPAWHEEILTQVALRWEAFSPWTLGATGRPFTCRKPETSPCTEARIEVAVVGAHLSEMPLNHQLTNRNATLIRRTTTNSHYRLYRIPATEPPKPGLVYTQEGSPIAVEIWSMPLTEFGSFVGEIPAPLTMGTLELQDGSLCKGFLCEPRALEGAEDITRYGGWKAWIFACSNDLSMEKKDVK